MKQGELLEKYKKILEANAKRLSWKRNDSKDYWFNECYLVLLEAYRENPSITSDELIKAFNIGIRDSDRRELRWKKNIISYGQSLEMDSEDDTQTPAQKAQYKIAMRKKVEEERWGELRDILNRLEKRERKILILYYFDNYKEKEIAKYYNISIAMVSKIKKRALKKCKKFLEKGVKK